MDNLKFKVLALNECDPNKWLEEWAAQYRGYDDKEYECLISLCNAPSYDYFVRVGRWKEGITKTKDKRWRENVASVAYVIWLAAANELPQCPKEEEVKAFLEKWSSRTYINQYVNGRREIHFGLSRASTLLHFISGGRYPIFDSRVRTAVSRLLGCRIPDPTISIYLEEYFPLFGELAIACETKDDLRKLDKALFSYGASTAYPFSM